MSVLWQKNLICFTEFLLTLYCQSGISLGVGKGRDLWYNGSTMITKENKDKAIAKVARNKADVGSPEVQVSILTERIKEVTEHVKANKHDFMAKRGLMQMVGKRKKLLKYLEETDFELYKKTVKKLGLRK